MRRRRPWPVRRSRNHRRGRDVRHRARCCARCRPSPTAGRPPAPAPARALTPRCLTRRATPPRPSPATVACSSPLPARTRPSDKGRLSTVCQPLVHAQFTALPIGMPAGLVDRRAGVGGDPPRVVARRGVGVDAADRLGRVDDRGAFQLGWPTGQRVRLPRAAVVQHLRVSAARLHNGNGGTRYLSPAVDFGTGPAPARSDHPVQTQGRRKCIASHSTLRDSCKQARLHRDRRRCRIRAFAAARPTCRIRAPRLPGHVLCPGPCLLMPWRCSRRTCAGVQ